ncbi:hypothetical protein HER10_EVM0011141 [Colletotrichum scovillei]|uniref:ArcA-like protein n=1 Tax=Colletotrichum scovillei TaxID=1209932 RepID=A0A9P7R3X6_9PEZI|nr:uncharacterized protein HER10_EVM0011141 [Colletotrichum scovillei]KAF4774281.1 hypothetical protein HER10_EVM0011141 [Colletotrichum scovillei]KAG7048282.1 ArcA-like protein [Colletotrichum scovillei]KAG7065448.1 ArcA-like protein [Colletotrichum scovillei]KAG7068052.1 ArcA-like protein [Colletotrichum scovillei]
MCHHCFDNKRLDGAPPSMRAKDVARRRIEEATRLERERAEEDEEEEEKKEKRHLPNETFVQAAPSHDGAPTFAAYQIHDDTPESDLSALQALRPPFGFVVYDTTETARPARSAQLARALFDHTKTERTKIRYGADRIEVVTLPLPITFSLNQRVETCTRHYDAEYQSRLRIADKAEAASWFLAERIMDRQFARRAFVIDCIKEDGDGSEDESAVMASWKGSFSNVDQELEAVMQPNLSNTGSFVEINWQPRKGIWNFWNREYCGPEDSMSSCRFGSEAFGDRFQEMRDAIEVFYNHFVPDGILDRRLDQAGAARIVAL